MFTLPDLPYEPNALEPYIDTQTMLLHHDKHHATYVKNVNDALSSHQDLLSKPIEEIIKNLNSIPEDIRMKVRNNGGGHYNHSLFWTIMSANGQKEPSGTLLDAIKQSFGDIKTLKEKMSQAGIGRFGSGWVWLYVNDSSLAVVDMPNQDTPLMDGKIPILGLDVWEHAYYLKYQNRRQEYIEAWWNVVNWYEVARRYDEAIKSS